MADCRRGAGQEQATRFSATLTPYALFNVSTRTFIILRYRFIRYTPRRASAGLPIRQASPLAHILHDKFEAMPPQSSTPIAGLMMSECAAALICRGRDTTIVSQQCRLRFDDFSMLPMPAAMRASGRFDDG